MDAAPGKANVLAKNKLADPYFTMLWDNDIPRRRFKDETGHTVELTVIAGAIDGIQPLAPPPHSWAANPEAEVAIWSIAIEPGATWIVPPVVRSGVLRTCLGGLVALPLALGLRGEFRAARTVA